MAEISMITPASRGTAGNAVTAVRWTRVLRRLGHRVRVAGTDPRDEILNCDLLVALHARKSAAAVRRFHRLHPARPIVVVLTGTDLYHDLRRHRTVGATLDVATRIVVLQPLARAALPAPWRRKCVVITQSATRLQPTGGSRRARTRRVRTAARHRASARRTALRRRASARRTVPVVVVVLAHLRAVKDPLRAALAARRLPTASRIRVVHAGRALDRRWADRAQREALRNRRYRWRGEVSADAARRLLASAAALVVSSRAEGGANVVSEAIVAGVPVLASHIPGNVGLLGANYPAYFPAGDAKALAALMWRLESDAAYRARLQRRIRRLAPRFTPARERVIWRRLVTAVLRP